MSSDRLAAMEIFVRVVDARSFSSAATQLGIGQPAVSKTVAQLEDRLGVQLLVRSPRGLTLTDAGRGFLDNARRIIGEVEHAERVASGERGLSGTLRVSATLCFSRIHVLPRLPELLAQRPDLNIEIACDDRFVNLAEEGFDLALRTGNLTDSSLIARKIGLTRRRVMATRGYWEAHGKPRHPDELFDHEHVILQRNGGLVDSHVFRKGAMEAPVKVHGRMKVSAVEALREAVLAGIGPVVVSDWLFSPELATGAIEAVLDDWELPKQDLSAVYPPGGATNLKARDFVAFVERFMALPFTPPLSIESARAIPGGNPGIPPGGLPGSRAAG
jgi:DNA-binding transcriptional LysR family regulator